MRIDDAARHRKCHAEAAEPLVKRPWHRPRAIAQRGNERRRANGDHHPGAIGIVQDRAIDDDDAAITLFAHCGMNQCRDGGREAVAVADNDQGLVDPAHFDADSPIVALMHTVRHVAQRRGDIEFLLRQCDVAPFELSQPGIMTTKSQPRISSRSPFM